MSAPEVTRRLGSGVVVETAYVAGYAVDFRGIKKVVEIEVALECDLEGGGG